ncbi:MAG: hypothetical protein FWF68_04760, partial [Spirochaetes bacterium]|nr:hypothetical protein [Spirochaetota bacterium]
WAGEEEGNLIISVGGNGQARGVAGGEPADIDKYLHIITITGAREQKHETRFIGSGKASFFVPTGRWHIDVKAYDISDYPGIDILQELPDELRPIFEGSTDIDVTIGDNPVTITMARPVDKDVPPTTEENYTLIVGIITGQNGYGHWYNAKYNNDIKYGTVSYEEDGTKENDYYSTNKENGAIKIFDLKINDTVKIEASANDGYKFVKWVEIDNINETAFTVGGESQAELTQYIQSFESIAVTEADGTKTITLYAVFDTNGTPDASGIIKPKNITSVEELQKIGQAEQTSYPINGSYALMTDLNFDEELKTGTFTPIINITDKDTFTGTFDGRGHCIDFGGNDGGTNKMGNVVLDPPYKCIGLFAGIDEGGVVKNLKLNGKISIGSDIYQFFYVGAVAGTNGGTIMNVISSVSIEGSLTMSEYETYNNQSFAGGIAGDNSGTIKNCVTVANVCEDGYVQYGGGIVGDNCGKIERCVTVGNVYATTYAGGIAGFLEWFSTATGTIINCVALNGGISARLYDGTDEYFGRIVGAVVDNALLQDNYARKDMTLNGTTTTSDGAAASKEGKGIVEDTYNNILWWKKSPSEGGPGFAFGKSEDSPWYWGEPGTDSGPPLKLWFCN